MYAVFKLQEEPTEFLSEHFYEDRDYSSRPEKRKWGDDYKIPEEYHNNLTGIYMGWGSSIEGGGQSSSYYYKETLRLIFFFERL